MPFLLHPHPRFSDSLTAAFGNIYYRRTEDMDYESIQSFYTSKHDAIQKDIFRYLLVSWFAARVTTLLCFFELPSIRQVDAGTFLFELHAERHPLIPQTDDRRCPSCAHVLLPIPIAVDGHGHDHIPYLMEMLPSIRQATTGICLF